MVAGYPKSGNTWLGQTFQVLGKMTNPEFSSAYDIYDIMRDGLPMQMHPAIRSEGERCVVIKTHSWKPYRGWPHREWISPVAVIRVTRNPLDVLLSYLNYSRWEIAQETENGTRPIRSKKWGYFFCIFLGLREIPNSQAWINCDLDRMKELGLLRRAVRQWVRRGLSIPTIDAIASSWSNNLLSWEGAPISGLVVRYEDMIADLPREGRRLALFLEVEEPLLLEAFRRQSASTGKDPLFFNQMNAYYGLQMVDRAELGELVNRYGSFISRCGYEDWLDRCLSC